MKGIQTAAMVLGRMCLSLFFIVSGFQKIADWLGIEQAVLNALHDLLNRTEGMPWAYSTVRFLIPWSPLLVVLAIVFDLAGGVLVFFGYRAKLGAGLLLLCLIPATLAFHSFWWLQGVDREQQLVMFLKNLSIAGGLLILLVSHGGGKVKSKPATPEKA